MFRSPARVGARTTVDPCDGRPVCRFTGPGRETHGDQYISKQQQRVAAAAETDGLWRRPAATVGGQQRRPAARTKMPRDCLARGLEVEAALAAEATWELKEAVASMAARSLDMDVDSPPHLPMETLANQVILDAEEHSLEVPAIANEYCC
ncbi:uncharacterized protein LOC120691326 [Panicum virgatum]|nr:uncharacterized protein LOC120691326 [Panicum virgatum]